MMKMTIDFSCNTLILFKWYEILFKYNLGFRQVTAIGTQSLYFSVS